MAVKDTIFSKKLQLNINGQLLDLSTPIVMAIVNITPDSFYSGSRSESIDDLLKKVKKHIDEGASIIDVGAYSSRPGAENISVEEEKARLKPAFEVLRKNFPELIISLDTFRASIATWAVEEFGINIINDISGGLIVENMFETIARLRVPYILMHMRGTSQTMQQYAQYQNVTKEVIIELSQKLEKLHLLGVSDIIIDPGFGFSKTVEQNYQMLNELDIFKIFEKPLLVGISRKSMIYKLLGNKPEDALNGSTVLNTIALQKGANILRVHDVKEAVEAIRITEALKNF